MLPHRSMKLFFVLLFSILASGWLTAQESITFCSYNLKNYLKMERFVGGKRTEGIGKPEKEIAAVLKFILEIKPDLLGVCEIGSEDDLKDLQARLKAQGLDLPHFEHSHGGDPTRHLALLSRFPIVAVNSQENLKYQIGEQVFSVNRGFLDATVELRKDFPLRLVGVHLKSKRTVPEGDEMLMRRNEAHLLRKHLESILKAAPETRLLAYGDFNEHKNEAPIVEIEGVSGTDLSMMDILLRDSRGETWTHFWEAADVYSRFDYCFVNRALQSYIDKRKSHIYDSPDYYDGSDHRALVIKIDLVKDK
jgi:endonuclease/exonuclease/phosphatase family metal-dependent hydrolase